MPGVRAQKGGADTLLLQGRLLLRTVEDTARANLLIELAEAYAAQDPKKFDQYATMALRLCDKLRYMKGAARIGRDIGLHHQIHVQDQYGAVDLFLNALHAAELAQDSGMMAKLYTDIGGAYTPLGRDSLAESYLFRSIALARDLKDTLSWSRALYALARLRAAQRRLSEGIGNDRLGLQLAVAVQDTPMQATHLLGLGLIFAANEELDSSIAYLERSDALFGTLEDHRFQAFILGQLSLIHWNLHHYERADSMAREGLRIALAHNLRKETMDNYKALSLMAASRGDHKAAYTYRLLYDAYNDSTTDVGAAERAGRTEAQLQAYKREEAARKQRDEEQAVAQNTERRQRLLLLLIGAVALAIAATAFVIFRSLRLTRKQNRIIEEQKRSVEVKQRAIIDSINYSQGLQQAILPPAAALREHFVDGFVLYMPKDIVSGDFYWMDHYDDTVFVAAADSTGHGVPGALVSVVCANALTQAVKDHGLRETGPILDKARELVLNVFDRNPGDVKDGMDISLLSWQRSTGRLQWSGANLPLWMITDPADGKRPSFLKKLRPDRQPVGKHPAPKPFTTRTFTAPENTTFYLFTDGFADQFGGPKGKKFMPPQFEATILSTYDRGLITQARALERVFHDWRKAEEQTDDVTVLGLRI